MEQPRRDIHALWEWWGHAYDICWDFQKQVFRAVRLDDSSVILEDPDAAELWQKIYRDCKARPVILDVPAPGMRP